MTVSVRPEGEVHTLGESQLWPAVLLPLALAAALIAAAVIFRFFYWFGYAAVAASLIVAVVRRRNAILADDRGLLIRDRRGLRRSYAWTEIDRLGWASRGLWGSALEVHPSGGPYDVPGPNSPTRVGTFWQPGRRGEPDPLPGLCRRHGLKSALDP